MDSDGENLGDGMATRPAIERRREVLEFYQVHGDPEAAGPIGASFLALAPLELGRDGVGRSPAATSLRKGAAYVRSHEDCGDFAMAGLLRARLRSPAVLPADLAETLDDAMAAFTYWFDEPCDESMSFVTENHQILFHSAEYLAGDHLPQRTFADGESGATHRDRGRRRVDRWLGWRVRFGFSEWLSNTYLEEDLMALINLAEFAPDASIRARSLALIDLCLFELALHSHRGVFGSTHGRTDAPIVMNPRGEPIRALAYLLWGDGSLEPDVVSLAALAFAASDYRPPPAITTVARDRGPLTVRSRHGLDVAEADRYGLDPTDPDDLPFFWSSHVWNHRDVVETSLAVAPESHYMHDLVAPAASAFHELEAAGETPDPDPNKSAMTRANVYTHRTPDYMLSAVQDYRPGRFGFQQHVWQATLSDRAVVYTTHPRSADLGDRPDYWRGNAVLPRAAAHGTSLVCLYRSDPAAVDTIPEGAVDLRLETFCDYTHAFVPRYAFDEVVETDGWVLGRAGDGYLGLTATAELRWAEPIGEIPSVLAPLEAGDGWQPGPCELVAPGYETAWVCEVGRPETHGDFDDFVDAVAGAPLTGGPAGLRYDSPHTGTLEFGWEGPLHVDGERVPLDGYPRFETPYCRAPFDAERYEIAAGGQRLSIDFDADT